ncbi:mechanosensitive ion channel family protein [Ancylobacter pratisalsi]|uniref:Mechanosensitive ion channel family protein n=1 Tax=Ancylobacter pratisalsi TaxID=1745854 RepID=A0A6P1YUY9_9HYPH|nr:mechanosensitive ion channel family protein [Ancylobacter pratisalsi]QIB35923.1 mechanosensitive ion channel family protein [Ancylobacter pratisalsi]
MSGDDHYLPLALINILGIAGIVIWHLQGRSRPTGRLIGQILVFAGMCLVVYTGGIAPHQPDDVHTEGFAALLSKSARVLWWTHLAWTIIGLIHIYVRLNRKPREAHLILDMAVAVIYLGVALSVMGFVFGMPVASLVTTSGVVALTLGLALQNTLGDVFSGIALTLGKAYAIGDWVQLSDGTAGRVTETNWRSTNLLTVANNVVVLPNSTLARQVLTSLSRTDETHQIKLGVRFAAVQSPRLIEEAMRSVLQSSIRIVKDPSPAVALTAIDAVAIEVELQFHVASLAVGKLAKNEIIELIHGHCKADGLALALPAQSLVFVPATPCGEASAANVESRSPGAPLPGLPL